MGVWQFGSSAGHGSAINHVPIKRLALAPQYPPEALLRGIEGEVVVEFTVAETGTVEDLRIIAAKPPRLFNREVINAVRRWQFRPAMENGKPVARRVRETVSFVLENQH